MFFIRQDTDNNELKEIGIRGDCVFAVYSVLKTSDIYDIAKRAFYINTYMKMLNRLLETRKLPTIKAGIGLAAKETLAVKAGRKSSGVNNLVWIGKSVARASKLSDLGNKNGTDPIVMCDTFYYNYIKEQKKTKPNAESWWEKKNDNKYGLYYHGNVIINDFNKWINNGMNG